MGRLRVFRLGADSKAWLGACYLMTERAYVGLELKGATPRATLWPKPGKKLAGLAEAFSTAYQEQLRGWTLARRNRRERFKLRAADAAQRIKPNATPDGLEHHAADAAQRREISRLLAEELQMADPLGIRTPWDEARALGLAMK